MAKKLRLKKIDACTSFQQLNSEIASKIIAKVIKTFGKYSFMILV